MAIALGDSLVTKGYIMDSDFYISTNESEDEFVLKGVDRDSDINLGLVIITLKEDLESKNYERNELIKNAGTIQDESDDLEDMENQDDSDDEDVDDSEDLDSQATDNNDEEIDESNTDEDSEGESEEEIDVAQFETSEAEVIDGGNSDFILEGETSDNGSNSSAGTIISQLSHVPSKVEMVIFIILIITIPCATFLLRKKWMSKEDK